MPISQLKYIAVIIMLLDHMQTYLGCWSEHINIIGRLAAPIFMFCSVIAMDKTRDQKKYLKRLYIFSLITTVSGIVVFCLLNGIKEYNIWMLEGNFITTLFIINLIVYLIKLKKVRYIVLFIVLNILSTFLLHTSSNDALIYIFMLVTGNVLLAEGGFLIVLMGVAMYFTKDSKLKLAITYTIFCVLVYFSVRIWGNRGLFPYYMYQWRMIFALPLLLLYNGEKGSSPKYFFYIFYPLHLAILNILSVVMGI